MPRAIVFLPLIGALMAPVAAAAQAGGLADPAAIDVQVAAFTGANAGSPGGARNPVDRRLRLASCPVPLSLAWHGRAADMVRVECPAAPGWKIFVPVNSVSGGGPNAGAAARAVTVVERGQYLTITVMGRGFSVSQQGEALEDGAIGAWIRIRPEGNKEVVRARIETPQRAVIPLGQ